jgi:uncharacterized protein (TIGR02001 family)
MKKVILAIAILVSFTSYTLQAQEEEKTGPSFTAGADVYSNYIWRGTKFGSGPAFQPTVKFTAGGFTAGVWGSFDAAGYTEADPYISYTLPVGLSVGLTSYYYPGLGGAFLADSSNANELNVGFTKGGLSLSANYIFNEAALPASMGGDMYFQVTYAFKKASVFIGAGNGWHTIDDDNGDDVFAVCNIGLSTSKEIKITDTFSIPVTGQIVYNPDSKLMHMVVGLSF